jgi:hypothetical protein
VQLNKINSFSGRVLWVDQLHRIYVAWQFDIFRTEDQGKTWQKLWTIPVSGWKPKCAKIRLAARLLRQEIRTFCLLSDGTGIAVTKSGIFRGETGKEEMELVMVPSNGTPLNICFDNQDRVLFGDYGFKGMKRLYVSTNKGKSFEEFWRFDEGDIRHVHGIQPDLFDGGFWVFAGDFDTQPGIARLSDDLKNFDWIERGHQMVRTVKAIIEPNYIYYGTDTEFEQNYIVKLDKKTGKWERLQPIAGASLHATRFGNLRIISTSVDSSQFCEQFSALYVSIQSDENWNLLKKYDKDFWSPRYFQYGTCVLPNNVSETSWGIFSGQALKKIDGQTIIFEWNN